MTANKEVLRKLAFHYVSADVAAAANMTVQQMKLFIQGSYQPSQQQLEALAKRIDSHMGGKEKSMAIDSNVAQAIVDAAARVGDEDGKGGLAGYLRRLQARYPKHFAALAAKARAASGDNA